MAHCTRHLKALIKKNFLLWFRNIGCSSFELLAPILMMAIVVIIRYQIPTTSVDAEGMLQKKYPSTLGVDNLNGTWDRENSNDIMNRNLRPLYNFTGYHTRHNPDPLDYDMGYDWYSAQFFAPTQCLLYSSWSRPRAASPVIGVIGNRTNITDSFVEYYQGISAAQHDTAAVLATPTYRPMYFEN